MKSKAGLIYMLITALRVLQMGLKIVRHVSHQQQGSGRGCATSIRCHHVSSCTATLKLHHTHTCYRRKTAPRVSSGTGLMDGDISKGAITGSLGVSAAVMSLALKPNGNMEKAASIAFSLKTQTFITPALSVCLSVWKDIRPGMYLNKTRPLHSKQRGVHQSADNGGKGTPPFTADYTTADYTTANYTTPWPCGPAELTLSQALQLRVVLARQWSEGQRSRCGGGLVSFGMLI